MAGCALGLVAAGCGRRGFEPLGPDGAAGPSTALTLGALTIDNVTTSSFDVVIAFQGDDDATAQLELRWCNDTDQLGCTPSAGPAHPLTRGPGVFSGSFVASPPDDPDDTLTLEVTASDPDGVSGSPARAQVMLSPSAGCAHGMMSFAGGATPIPWTVPAGCGTVTVKAWAGGGGGAGGDTGDTGAPGGAGGFARSTLAVTPGESLTLMVGGGGHGGAASPLSYVSGGGGGGDLSGIRRGLTWLVVAGGGGGAAGNLGGGAPAAGVGGGAAGTSGGTDGTRAWLAAVEVGRSPLEAGAGRQARTGAPACRGRATRAVPGAVAPAVVAGRVERSGSAEPAGRAAAGPTTPEVVGAAAAATSVVAVEARGPVVTAPRAAAAGLAVAAAGSRVERRAC